MAKPPTENPPTDARLAELYAVQGDDEIAAALYELLELRELVDKLNGACEGYQKQIAKLRDWQKRLLEAWPTPVADNQMAAHENRIDRDERIDALITEATHD